MTCLPAKILSTAFVLACAMAFVTPALATQHGSRHKPSEKTKPIQIGSFGDWGAFLAKSGTSKTCYALTQPKERAPANLHRNPAYIFVSDRPSENIHNEVSIIMGFPMKDGGLAEADVGSAQFALVSKGGDAWVKNPAKEGELIVAMKKGATLIVKATSARGNETTDSYSLKGLTEALASVEKACR